MGGGQIFPSPTPSSWVLEMLKLAGANRVNSFTLYMSRLKDFDHGEQRERGHNNLRSYRIRSSPPFQEKDEHIRHDISATTVQRVCWQPALQSCRKSIPEKKKLQRYNSQTVVNDTTSEYLPPKNVNVEWAPNRYKCYFDTPLIYFQKKKSYAFKLLDKYLLFRTSFCVIQRFWEDISKRKQTRSKVSCREKGIGWI